MTIERPQKATKSTPEKLSKEKLRQQILEKTRDERRKELAAQAAQLAKIQAEADEREEENPLPEDITKEQLIAAKAVITSTLKTLGEKPFNAKLLKKKITLKKEYYYLAIVVKESRCKPDAKSETGAIGYFQLTPIAVAQVNETFKTKLTFEDVKNFPEKNALAGILYWHFCENIAPRAYKFTFTDKENSDFAAAFRYNAGPGVTRDLYYALGAPKTYNDFEKLIAKKLSEAFPNEIKTTDGRMFERKGYGLKFYSEVRVTGSIEKKKITISGAIFSVEKIIEALRYGRIIRAIRRDEKYRV
ncbi:MAG: transglycosylase SLT domain-containing protein [Candidatus Gracilibacteria bacterium]|jgi:hypothetical protein